MRLCAAILLLVCQSLFAQASDKKPDYLNHELPVAARVADLVGRMTLEEKISQMGHGAAAIPRLNIPAYNWWNECLHGVARAGTATVFPQAIALAATWNTDLMQQIAEVTSTEARAKHHDFARKGDRDIYKGLTFWSPNINIFRDPRWGRGQETYGEDPYLTARMGVAFVKGLQGDDPKYFKVIATPKHFAVHSGPEPDRHAFDAITDNHDLYDTYLPAFEACLKEAGAFSVMCAYNRYMGDACCGSPRLLQKILREDWGFEGYVVSDCGAIADIYQHHKIANSAAEAAAIAVKAGTDLNCGSVYGTALLDAVKQGLLSEKDIDASVNRLFTARFKLGMFDPPEMVKYAAIPIEENDSAEHRRLSLRAALESIVLLKNESNILPLKKDLKRIAVIGPTANSYAMLLGNYNGTPSKYVTPLQGIRNKAGRKTEVIYENGCDLIAEGTLTNELSSEMLSAGGKPGLQAEYFRSTDLTGEPFFTRLDPIDNVNWIYGTRLPNLRREPRFSIRWRGTLTAPATGEFNFTVKGDDGYRLAIEDKTIVEDWNEHEAITSRSNHVRLEKGKSYNFKLEFFHNSGRAQLSVQWQLLNVDHFKNAVDLAGSSEVVIFAGGITAQLEGEEMQVDYEGFKGGDRTNLDLPKVQENLLKAIHATGTPVVLVLSSGSALAVNWEKENIPAIIQLWYPGQEGGTALADVLFGDYNPAGRLPITFYKSVAQLPAFEDYNMKGRTYRYFAGEPLFPFGYGLSYTKFEYRDLALPREARAGEEIKISVVVQNSGKLAGDEVVQLYVKDVAASVPKPVLSLQGFRRVHLKPGEKQVVEFRLQPRQLAVLSEKAELVVEPGTFEITAGGVLPGTSAATTESVTKEITLVGENYPVN
jgi:beta-glucosidase